MSIREKLLRVKQSAPLYKLQTPQVLKEECLNANSKKWLTKGIDITDYFNYGFNDATLKLFIQKLNKLTDLNLSKLQKEYTARIAQQKATVFKDNIPIDYGGLGITSVSECLPEEIDCQKESLIFQSIDYEGDLIFTNETILDIFRHYKQYLEQLVANGDYFDFEAVMQYPKEENKWQKELEKLLKKDSNQLIDEFPDKKRIKHEKKKSKKEKKQKKEKKKKHKKKYSPDDSIQIVPQQIVVKQDSPSIESNKIECELQIDSLSDHLSQQPQEEIQLSSPSPIPEIQQQQLPTPQPQEQIRQRNHNWPRNLIHGILQGNKNQQKR
ncbi:unnamed protein product (macronuclear) [Paramecium tetraurelia]|uniref:Pre-mRNA polyadenylation factor Fip1 domain-containing protein n=1 Tax=Paramecium tetraurelia TaxID=5888 RepID=A0E8C1_PARTE|nr:uncharacterized protein GSPATT00024266001 [Paramecium tetraurelia]CAK91538.1 unnamed protein product [Paramecium tetraurelia]|eukprot:XP_001458935.1 hypothetical protein (macronuclear) [Paramecium tetraurelia strain d4-2]